MSVNSQMLAVDTRACVACGSQSIVPGERISRSDLALAWQREDEATATPEILAQRASAIQASVPEDIRFERCAACGLEMAVRVEPWSADAYPRDQSYPTRWEFQRAIDDLGASPLDVLEIGCGTGLFLQMASARGHRAVGIDFSDSAVAEARDRGQRAFCGGFDRLEQYLGQARFDAVALFQVIEHVPDPDRLLAAVAQWTRPGARLFLSCPGPRRYTRAIREHQAGASDFWDYPPHHVLRWTLPALRAVLTRHGWHVDAAIEEPFSWVAAASHVGIARAIRRRALDRPMARRVSIGIGWLRVFAMPTFHAGMSLYVSATGAAERMS